MPSPSLPTDNLIYQWFNGYPSTDSNAPTGDTLIGSGLDNQLRNIKSVVRDESVNKQWERWRGLYGTLARVDGDTFTLSGDRRVSAGGPVELYRRVKVVGTATVYGTISGVAFGGGLTTVDVALDSGTIDTGLSEVMFGAMTATNTSLPSVFNPQSSTALYAVATGTDTYVGTLAPAILGYVTGPIYVINFTNANTGAATLNLNGLGAKAVVKNGSTALASGDISAGEIKALVYDGTNFQMVGGGSSVSSLLSCRVFNSANLTAGAGPSTTIVTFDSERYDASGMHSTSSNTGRITMAVAGLYTLGYVVDVAALSGGSIYIRVNGATKIAFGQPTATTDYRFTAGQYAEVIIENLNPSSRTITAAGNYTPEFWARYVGP